MTKIHVPSIRTISLGICAALATCALCSDSAAEASVPVKKSYAKSFPIKANPDGSPLPRSLDVLKLSASREVTVKPVAKKVCFFGDLDLIRAELSWAGASEIIVSIEPLDDSKVSTGSAAVLPLESINMTKGFAKLKVPEVTKPTVMGLYICKDSSKTGSCRNKVVTSPLELLNRYSPTSDPSQLKDFPDRVYYFHRVVVSPDSLSSSSAPLDKKGYEQTVAMIRAEGSQGAPDRIAQFSKLQFTLSSAPLRQSGDTLQPLLPISDFKNCGSKGTKK